MKNHIMKAKKSLLQKISAIIGGGCFISTLITLAILAIYHSELTDIYRGSLAAIAFFFFTVAIVLFTIANTNLPKLKFDKSEYK